MHFLAHRHHTTMLLAPSLLLPSLLLFIIHLGLSPIITAQQRPAPEGEWRLLHESIGISAMHMQLLKNNRVVIFDRTDFGPSNISLPNGRCRNDPNDKVLKTDCTAHSILYDVRTNAFRALTVQTDTWCSSGSVLPNGTLVQTGGFNDGDHAVRTLAACPACDWLEFPHVLAERRWYASNHILPDGRVVIVGGRAQFNYEFYPPQNSRSIRLDFLRETKDGYENNLYPFLHLLPDGNLFIFANRRSIILDYKQNRVVRNFPAISGGDSRNYPSSGSSALLPIDENSSPVAAEVMICGGSSHNAFQLAERGTFLRAATTCGRLRVTDAQPAWEMEKMPSARVMSDMLLLPTGDVIIINGAGSGAAGWESARNPVTTPYIYRPDAPAGRRFTVVAASPRPRMYHSTAILLADGRVLVGGSNPHIYYNFTGVDFPTDLSLESFSPPYLSEEFDPLRPRIVRMSGAVSYNKSFALTFKVAEFLEASAVSVRIMSPPFNTHSFSMNQRMVVLRGIEVSCLGSETYAVAALGPSALEIAPPGYYVLFLVHAQVPSSGMWIQIR